MNFSQGSSKFREPFMDSRKLQIMGTIQPTESSIGPKKIYSGFEEEKMKELRQGTNNYGLFVVEP